MNSDKWKLTSLLINMFSCSQHLPFLHQPNAYTLPLTTVNIPTPLHAAQPALQLGTAYEILAAVNQKKYKFGWTDQSP